LIKKVGAKHFSQGKLKNLENGSFLGSFQKRRKYILCRSSGAKKEAFLADFGIRDSSKNRPKRRKRGHFLAKKRQKS
jgi:hypothetical protein